MTDTTEVIFDRNSIKVWLHRNDDKINMHALVGKVQFSHWQVCQLDSINGIQFNGVAEFRKWAGRVREEIDRPKCSQSDIKRFKERVG